MSKVLVIYGTTEGQTAKIARRIGDVLVAHQLEVSVLDGRRLPPGIALTDFDGVIIGASMHVGGYQKYIRSFIRLHRAELERRPAAFFSVSLTEAYPQPEERARLDSHLTRLFDATGWHPKTVASFAGALAYSRYSVFKRLMMQQIARQVGAPTDPTRDVEYTDWEAVTRFAERFATSLPVATDRAPAGARS